MLQDVLFTLRSFRRQPGFFAVAICTLALGVASTSAVFSLFYQVLLRTLPVASPNELVVFHAEGLNLPGGRSSDNSETVFSYPMYTRLRDGAADWRGVIARSGTAGQFATGGANERVRIEVVSGNFFQTLGVQPAVGRLLTAADDSVRGGNPVAVISYGFYQRRFGGDASKIGSKVTVSGQPFEIAGVAPERFRGVLSGDDPDIYVPISMRGTLTAGWDNFDRPTQRWLSILGRVPASGDPLAIRPLFSAIVRDHVQQAKITNASVRSRIEASVLTLNSAASGLNELKRQWKEPLVVLLVMVWLLLLIACANLANLLLARGLNRGREIAIRVSIGASRGQIMQLLLVETAAITVTGAALGAAFSPVLVDYLLRAISHNGNDGWLEAGLSWPVLAFSILLAGLCTILAGMVPAWQTSGPPARRRTGRARHFFVAAQVALSLVLLTVAGLFGRSLSNLLHFDPGFQASRLTTFVTNPGFAGYDAVRGNRFVHDVQERLAALPGVQMVSVAESGPLQGSTSSGNIQLEGYKAGAEEDMDCNVMAVGPGYFQVLGTAVVSGRVIEERDSMDAPKVAVVNQAFVRRFLKPGENVLGRHMSIGAGNIPLDIEIIGVVADTKHGSLREAVSPTFFRSYEQAQKGRPSSQRATFFVRSAGAAPAKAALRAAVSQSDPTMAVYSESTMEKAVDQAIVTDRLIAGLSMAFGGLALLITAIGLYGVLSYLTQRRTAEFGIRMALGATQGNILRLVLWEVFLLVGAGSVAGGLAALGAGQAISAQLFGVDRFDPLVLTAAPLLMALVGLLAASRPTLTAASVQPSEALRHE